MLPRQQTLQASVDWSYELLSERERAAFRRLAVFAGGFTLDAAERVAAGGDIEPVDVLDLLVALVDKSMIDVDDARCPLPDARVAAAVRRGPVARRGRDDRRTRRTPRLGGGVDRSRST